MSTRHCTGDLIYPRAVFSIVTVGQQQDSQELVRNANSLPQPRLTALLGYILRSPLADSDAYSSFRTTVPEKLSHLCSHLFQKDIMSRYQGLGPTDLGSLGQGVTESQGTLCRQSDFFNVDICTKRYTQGCRYKNKAFKSKQLTTEEWVKWYITQQLK